MVKEMNRWTIPEVNKEENRLIWLLYCSIMSFSPVFTVSLSDRSSPQARKRRYIMQLGMVAKVMLSSRMTQNFHCSRAVVSFLSSCGALTSQFSNKYAVRMS